MLELTQELWGNKQVTKYIAKDEGFSQEQILDRLNFEI